MRRGTPINACLGLGLALLTASHLPAAAESASRLYDPADLPSAVARTRQALLATAPSGDLKRLRPIVAGAEQFRFSYAVEPDPIAYWRDIRAQRGGRLGLRALAQALALALPAARTKDGVFVWPYLAQLPAHAFKRLDAKTAADVSLLMTRQRWNARATAERARNGGGLHRLPGVDRGRRDRDRVHLRRLKRP
jgi:hypothetical protein